MTGRGENLRLLCGLVAAAVNREVARGVMKMIRSGHVKSSAQELNALAWEFLGSEFTTEIHVDWPIDRCLDAYLRKHGLINLINDGATYNDLLDRVMANIAPASRMGLLKLPHFRPQPS